MKKMGVIRKGCSHSFPGGKLAPCSAIMKRNPYRVLGISQDADLSKIKKAYWKAARRYHPDLSPGTSNRFREAQEAYDILSNPQKRSRYDEKNLRKPPARRSSAAPTRSPRSPFDFFDRFFLDFQDRWFGHMTEPLEDRKRGPGSLAAEIILSPEEAEQGCEIFVPVQYEILCEYCQGGGRFFGYLCDHCLGWGKIGREREVRLRIPAGVRNGVVERIPIGNSGHQEIFLVLTFRINRNW